jgi:hydroxyacylglutathione hydrolase
VALRDNVTTEITAISLGGLLGYGANCYLIRTDIGYVLIDTGYSSKRSIVERELDSAGCRPGSLKLIVLTHGHGDHAGNAAYLRRKYAAPIAMQRGDSSMVEGEDADLSAPNRIILRMLGLVLGLGKVESFKPDICFAEGDRLSDYGFDAQVLHLPGHSNGSIGILTTGGELFCGDLFVNVKKPVRHSIVVDAAELDASIARLMQLGVNRVYPGHGKPFIMADLIQGR